MKAFGYQNVFAFFIGFFVLGLVIGWINRNSSRQSRVKHAGFAALVLALFYPAVIAILAVGAVTNPFTFPEGRLAIAGVIGLSFIWVAGLVGLPLIAGVALPPCRRTPRSEQTGDGKPDPVLS